MRLLEVLTFSLSSGVLIINVLLFAYSITEKKWTNSVFYASTIILIFLFIPYISIKENRIKKTLELERIEKGYIEDNVVSTLKGEHCSRDYQQCVISATESRPYHDPNCALEYRECVSSWETYLGDLIADRRVELREDLDRLER